MGREHAAGGPLGHHAEIILQWPGKLALGTFWAAPSAQSHHDIGKDLTPLVLRDVHLDVYRCYPFLIKISSYRIL